MARSGGCGLRVDGRVGTSVRSLRPMRISAGDTSLASGLARYMRRAMCESSAFFKSFFTVWTALSASPLLCGYRGELVVWVNWYSYANSLNSALVLGRVTRPAFSAILPDPRCDVGLLLYVYSFC